MTEILSTREIKELQRKISNLHKNEFLEILKIIRNDPIKYTENKNGIFLNMMKLQPNTIFKIKELVDFCSQNSELLEQERIKRETIRSMVEREIQTKEQTVDQEQNNNVTIEQTKLNELEIDLDSWSLNQKYQDKNNQIQTIIDEKSNISTYRKTPKFSGTEARIIKKTRDSSSVEKTNK